MAEPEVEKKFIEDSLGVVGGIFGEQITHTVWVEANKSPTLAGTGFNKRLIVVGKYKLISIKKGTFGKSVELEFHLYNVSEICSESEDSISIKYNGENGEPLGVSIKGPLEKLQHLVRAIRTSYRKITCGFSEQTVMKINLQENKMIEFEEPLIMSAAHGFTDTYIAHSYFYKTVSTLDFVRMIEALYSTDCNELDFSQCPGIDPASELSFNLFTAIISLRHNTYFKSINLSCLPHANITNAIGMALETNKSITKLNLSNLRVEQSFQPLANGLIKNPNNSIQSIDLSKNSIPFPVMATLCDCFSKYSHGLVSLNLSKCELLPKSIVILFQSFERNFGMSLAIKYLNLSHNKFGDLGSQSIASWMAKIKGYHSLECLILSNCQLNFQIMGPPLRVVDVAHLDLSMNKIDRASSKLLGSEVFDSVAALKYLNFSGCAFNAESLEDIFISFNRNKKICNFQINLSHNALGAREATILSKSISGCRYLEAIDLSHNRLNCRSLMELLGAIKNIDQFNLHELNMGNNYFSQGPEGDQFCTQLAYLINTFPTIRTINISGGRYPLAKSLTPLLEALVNNKSLKELDISDNGLGDTMASIIGEMLRSNATIMYLNLDNNQFGLSGWASIAQPLLYDINRTLNHLIFPKTLASAYTSTIIQNFTSAQLFGSLSKDKRTQIIQLFQKMQDKLAENRFETSVLDSSNIYVSEYAIKQTYDVVLPNIACPLVPVPEHLSSLPPPPSPLSDINKTSATLSSSNTTPSNTSSSPLNVTPLSATTIEKKTHSRTDSNSSTTSNSGITTSTSATTTVAAATTNKPAVQNITNNSHVMNSPLTAAPPRALITQTSDWQPDESSEADIYESSNTNSYVAYSSEDDESDYTQNSEYESSSNERKKPIRKSKPKSKPNIIKSSFKSVPTQQHQQQQQQQPEQPEQLQTQPLQEQFQSDSQTEVL
ncbi:hypothetical protein DICPUDRAFT_99316 [Dictyostelium purpureum]|uniref:CARMIL pleckstrin homology domain-containing protein n=1 Tax=Dictyostelium purpureum TaxID=5786 RepID=F0ZY54_DICPU|nr:uncharacterized protein DICPUDRAFT_99316 [Dictyostelium purpureum]EGC31125.1 hypothetical protein DICPUDRAFT_99316 [Dictyostelium purpureum]|eukprot:XP_003292343.1 hypothetical protein DICPUDRAFT_99316 [Dictyostelium purpureum]